MKKEYSVEGLGRERPTAAEGANPHKLSGKRTQIRRNSGKHSKCTEEAIRTAEKLSGHDTEAQSEMLCASSFS
jgi:hypothetical protein